jgi:hypothetical protein
MKKMILAALTFLLTVGAQAQIVSSRSVSITQERKAPSETVIYGRVGLGFMNLKYDYLDFDSKLGYNVAIGFQKSLDTYNLYWGMEAGFGSRGCKYSDKEDYDEYEEGSLLAHNILVSPFNIGWKPQIGNDLKLDVHVGVYASYDFAGTIKDKDVYDGDVEEDSWGIGDAEGYKRFDVGINPGIGVWFGNYNIDLSLQRGFLEIVKDTKAHSQNILIRVGYTF